MTISQKDVDLLVKQFNGLEYEEPSQDKRLREEKGKKAWESWKLLWGYIKEADFVPSFGVSEVDWQIINWANDVTMWLEDAEMWQELIECEEQILQIQWEEDSRNLMYENAKRFIADSYAHLGDIQKAKELYEQYLKEDPTWGWGWIGYLRLIERYEKGSFMAELDALYERAAGEEGLRSLETVFYELFLLYEENGRLDKASKCQEYVKLIEGYVSRHGGSPKYEDQVLRLSDLKPAPAVKKTKIFPNDPCPCGSGKKYKKCCGRAALRD